MGIAQFAIMLEGGSRRRGKVSICAKTLISSAESVQ